MFTSSGKFWRKTQKTKSDEEAFDGNVWQGDFWDRMALVFYGWIFANWTTLIIQFSFTDAYGNNVFVMIFVMKVIGITLQFIFDKVFENRLFLGPFACSHTLTESVITFGASDFLDFIVGGFIDLGIYIE